MDRLEALAIAHGQAADAALVRAKLAEFNRQAAIMKQTLVEVRDQIKAAQREIGVPDY